MNPHLIFCWCISLCCLLIITSHRLPAQSLLTASSADSSASRGLFENENILEISLKGKIRDVLASRTGKAKSYPLTLLYNNEGGSEVSIPVKVKTRGNFRRQKENCFYPPLLIEFAKDGNQLSTVFSEQRKLKLVMPCTEDKYLVREWLVYKIYNLVTPKSFRARLVKVKLEDDTKKKEVPPFYGILLEEEKQMAKRNKGVIVEKKLLSQQTDADAFLSMAVFEYLIGNTDWSVPYLHNIKLLAMDSISIPATVPYDFDHSGIVNCPYANPAEELQLKSVQERRYRGYCIPHIKVFEPVIARYNQLKNDIYSIYTNCSLLEEKYIKSTIEYLDQFYKTINNPKTWQREFLYPCDGRTKNIVIKGLKEN